MTIDPVLIKGVVALGVGIVFCYVPSKWIVPSILCFVDDPEKIPPPQGSDEVLWKDAVSVPNKEAGGLLGVLERLIVLISLASQTPLVIGAWLAFKVAAKWEVWRNLVQVPSKFGARERLSDLVARRKWGSIMYMRFLIGTASNVLLGAIAYGLTWIILQVWISN